WNKLSDPLSVALPPGIYLTTAEFAVLKRTGFYPGSAFFPVNFTRSSTVPLGQTVTFNSYGASLPWPDLEQDGFSTHLFLRGTYTRHCPVTGADPEAGLAEFHFPLTTQVYSLDAGCYHLHVASDDPLGDKRPF